MKQAATRRTVLLCHLGDRSYDSNVRVDTFVLSPVVAYVLLILPSRDRSASGGDVGT
jgi:hypothetical protein